MLLHRSGYSMESEEGDIDDNPIHSLSSSKSNLSENSLVCVKANRIKRFDDTNRNTFITIKFDLVSFLKI